MPVALYRPRRPRASPLWQCLEDHREEFERHYEARFQKRDGYLRPEVSQTLDAFEACGDLGRGFARLHCDHCGHDYLIAFSCKQRYFCPSCHQKKVQQFGEFVRHEVVRKVPHRQIVVTIPKRLRKSFQFDRPTRRHRRDPDLWRLPQLPPAPAHPHYRWCIRRQPYLSCPSPYRLGTGR